MCKTYYVDPQTGRDTNDGLTPEKPLATLFAVNRLALAPGDTVLLKCGSVFEKQFLHLRCCGKKDSPITIAAYGEGPAPRIDADGQGLWYQDYGCALDAPTHVYRGYVSSAVLLYDAAYVTVRDLELTNRADAVIGEQYSQPDKLERTGVAVVAKDKGTRCGITLQNLLIHDVHGNVYDKHMNNGGIYMTALQPADETATGAARFADVLVEGCYVAHVSRWGIAAFTIGSDGDGTIFFAAAAQVQELLFKHAAAFQQHRVTGGQGQPVDGKQCGQRFFRRQAVVGVTACLRVHVIGLAQGCRTPPPASAFR